MSIHKVPGLRTCEPPSDDICEMIEARLDEGFRKVRSVAGFAEFPPPKVVYFNRRAAAGIAYGKLGVIALNRGLFERYLEENLRETVLHELAHLVVYYGKERGAWGRRRSIRSHGPEWQNVMRQWFAIEPERLHSQSVDHLVIRRQTRWPYRCRCKTWRLTTVRHNKIQQKGVSYHCRSCGDDLVQSVK